MADKDYDNELRGALFKNDRRREGKDDPQLQGSVQVGGVEYWLSAWKKTSSKGEQYYSLSFRPKNEQASNGTADDDDLL